MKDVNAGTQSSVLLTCIRSGQCDWSQGSSTHTSPQKTLSGGSITRDGCASEGGSITTVVRRPSTRRGLLSVPFSSRRAGSGIAQLRCTPTVPIAPCVVGPAAS
jgi:hypothetical protein